MSKNQKNKKLITLWIVRLQNYLSELFHSKIFASFCIFFVPITFTGYILQLKYNYEIFSKGIFIGLLWIGIAPLFVQDALKFLNTFFSTHKDIFRNKTEWETLRNKEFKNIQSSRYLLFGLPWAAITSLTILFSTFSDAPFLIQLWVGISFFMLFLISSIGFNGIYVMMRTIHDVCTADIIFNPFHPDNFGGISDFGRFSVKGTLYYSSGALLFPLAFEILSDMNIESNFTSVVIYSLSGFFVLTIIVTFLISIFEIKKFSDFKKEKIILNSQEKLDKMISNFRESKDLDIKKGIEILLYYSSLTLVFSFEL